MSNQLYYQSIFNNFWYFLVVSLLCFSQKLKLNAIKVTLKEM